MLSIAKVVERKMGLSLLQKPSNQTKEERSLILSLGFTQNGALVAPQHCHILRLRNIDCITKTLVIKQRNLTI